MVKKVVITLAILISIVLMFFISLFNGIRLGNFDFDNVNIQGLYLKYDKKLIVGTQSVTVFNDDRKKSTSFRLKFGIEPFFDKYFVSVEQFLMMDPYLYVSGNIILDLENINLDQISKTYINDFSIQFHQNLKSVHADICYVKYKNDNFYFSFDNPTYAGIPLDESKVIIENYELLKLKLKSKGMVNKELLSLLSNYKINLPLKQLSGENTTTVKLDIPFDIKKDIKAYSEITVKNGKIELYDIPLYVKDIDVILKENKLFAKGKLLKTSTEHDLEYDIDTDLIINFSNNKANGDFIINSGNFNKLSIKNANGKFILDFNDEFKATVAFTPQTKLKVDEEFFFVKTANTLYTDKDKTFHSKLSLKHLEYPLEIDIKDDFNIKSSTSSGVGKILLNKEADVVFAETIKYTTSFDNEFKLLFSIDKLHWYHNGSGYVIKNSSGEYNKGKVTSVLKYIETLDSESFIDNINLEYFEKSVKLQKEIFDNEIMANIDFTHGDVNGFITPLHETQTGKIKLFGNIYEKPYIHIPKWGGEFRALNKKHFIIKLAKPSFLEEFFTFLSFNEKSSLYMDKKKGMTLTAYVKNVDFDFKKFQEPQNFDNKPGLKYILYWEDSKITYDEYHFNFKKANLISSGDQKKIILTAKDGSKLDINSDTNSLVMKSNNLSGDYVNSIFKKDFIDGGTIEFFMRKNSVDSYTGTVKLKNTTLKDLQFIDNLLLFVNSSPALINPLLGIPALLRLGKDKFTVNGYNVVEGEFKFVYHKSTEVLEIKELKTVGNLNNFTGNFQINLANKKIDGKVNVAFLKDFATMVKYIPLVNKIILDKDDEISLPVTISGTLEDTKFSIK